MNRGSPAANDSSVVVGFFLEKLLQIWVLSDSDDAITVDDEGIGCASLLVFEDLLDFIDIGGVDDVEIVPTA